MLSPSTRRLIDALCALPGIGPKSAQRIAFGLLKSSGRSQASNLSSAITQALENITHCEHCRNYAESNECELCSHPKRNPSQLCIVESPLDVIAIEQTQSFRGRYFVLHGHLSPLDGIGPEELGLMRLFEKLNTLPIEELIIATNPTAEGEATAYYIASHLPNKQIRCTRIAHGVPMGGELEYLDGHTVTHALHSRQPICLED